MDKLKINVVINAAVKELDKLEQSLRQNNQRAVGAALGSIRRELYTLKTLIGEAGTVPRVQVVNPEDLDPEILSDLSAQMIANVETTEGAKLPFVILDQPPELDEDVLRALDEDWDQAKRGGESGHER